MKNNQQLELHTPPLKEGYLAKIDTKIKELKREKRKYPSGSLARTPICFEIGRLKKLKRRIHKEGISY